MITSPSPNSFILLAFVPSDSSVLLSVTKRGQKVRRSPALGLGLEVDQDCAIMAMTSLQPRIHFLILATLQLLTV